MEIEKNKHDVKSKKTKESLKTEAEQRVLRNSMQQSSDARKKDLDLAVETFKKSLQGQVNEA